MAYDCKKCGACCVSYVIDGFMFCVLSAKDRKRIPKKYQSEVAWNHGMCLLKAAPHNSPKRYPRCFALEGTVGRSVSCKIYKSRPTACREFTPGIDKCRWCREEVLGIED